VSKEIDQLKIGYQEHKNASKFLYLQKMKRGASTTKSYAAPLKIKCPQDDSPLNIFGRNKLL